MSSLKTIDNGCSCSKEGYGVDMNWMIIVLFIVIWLYVLSLFYRRKQSFFFFFVGGVGLFVLLFTVLEPVLTAPLARLVCYLTGMLGRFTGIFTAYASYGILFIESEGGPVSLYVDFECAGLVEILVYVSLLVFFQAYKWREKLVVGILGILAITAANILRLTIICVMIHFGGNEVYYLAHTIVGRLVFYVLAVMLYFYVFTRRQIKQQRVGEFSYNDKTE